MGKAKIIDRLELTRRKFDNNAPKAEAAVEEQEEHFGISKCQNCGQMTLIHEGGCSRCPSCGWSACG